eukprot:29722_1
MSSKTVQKRKRTDKEETDEYAPSNTSISNIEPRLKRPRQSTENVNYNHHELNFISGSDSVSDTNNNHNIDIDIDKDEDIDNDLDIDMNKGCNEPDTRLE